MEQARMLFSQKTRLVAALFTVAAISQVGCRQNPPPAEVPSTSTTTAPAKPFLEGWQKPAAALMLSGEQFGYLEPCGCSLTQSGGLARRAKLEAMLREKGWALAGLDLGGTLKRSRRQDQVKFEAILSGLKEIGYQAVGTGTAELHLPPDYLLSQFSEGDGIPLGGLLVSANVTLFDTPDLGVPKGFKIIEIGGRKIGVTSVLGKKGAEEVAPAGVQTNITVRDPIEALEAVLPSLTAEKPDLLVLLSHGSTEEAKVWAEKFPQFHVVLTAGGPEDPSEKPFPVGNTWVLEAGHKGKHIGILGYYPDATPPLKWELIQLDNTRFENDPRMDVLMKNYQQQLKDLDLARSEELLVPHPSGDKFIGAKVCGECHKKAFAKWEKSKHAHAFESLSKGRKGQEATWISRIHDPDCLACHVTGWDPQNVLRFESGYLDPEATAHLIGQQCENCHGPGLKHVELERAFKKDLKAVDRDTLMAARAANKLNSATAEKQVCHKCHDYENSPKFEFKKYWGEIHHPWKD